MSLLQSIVTLCEETGRSCMVLKKHLQWLCMQPCLYMICLVYLIASHVAAGLYSSSLTMRLAHLCDCVVGLEAVRDDSDIVRLIPEPAR